MLTVTLEMLEHMPSGARACDRARHWFEGKFPNGGERAEVWDACPNWQWKVWFAVHSATTEEAVSFAQACAERAAIYAAVARAAADSAATRAAADSAATRAVNAQSAAAYYDATAAVSDHALRAAVAAYKSAAYTADAAYYAGSAADEIQTLVDWARRVLFGEAPLHSVVSGENNGK